MPPPSKCPHCGAKGVKQFQPLTKDGYQCDVPYCGICGKNYPAEKPPSEPVTKIEDWR